MEEVKLYAMTCGWITMPYGFFMAGETGSLAIPVPCYLIEHPKGTVLFDTGLELPLQSEDESVVKKALGGFADLTTVDFVPGEDVAKRLEAFGVDPLKINFIINSHLHFDHCGGNACIPNARLIIQKREWQAAKDEVRRFFDQEVTRGYESLQRFSKRLKKYMTRNKDVNIIIKGFASPLAPESYNVALTKRRIDNVERYLKELDNGYLRPFFESGRIKVVVKPYGESKAATGVSDSTKNRQASVYNPKAARERRVEILQLKSSQNKTL